MKVERIKISSIDQIENSRGNVGKGIVPLMNSIQQEGLKQPIGVNYDGKGRYVILYGNRRLNACMKLGWTSIPAVIETDIDDKGLLINNTIENIQREDVSPAELGRICEQLESKGMNVDQISARLSLPISTIKSLLDLYKELPQEIRSKVVFHKLGAKKKGLTVSNVTNILNTRKKFGLNKDNISKLLQQSKDLSLSNQDIQLTGLLMQHGSSFSKSLSERKKYKNYRIDVIGLIEEVEELSSAEGINSINYLEQIVFGLKPPITKPDFIDFSKMQKRASRKK